MLYGVMAETYAFDEYNQLNQYESVTFDSQTQPMDYDLNGNVIQYDDKTFTYDYLNRMLTAADGSALNESYAYDSMGRRVLVDAEGTQTVYVYDGAQVIAEYSLVSQTLTLKKRFIYGPGIDEPICMIVYAAGSESGRYFYHFDGQGNVIALSNSSGNVVEEYEYDVYGLVSVQSLGQTWDRSQYGNPYLFTGRRWDGDTGLYYYRARMYSPDLGRFLQPDPLGYFDGMNGYAYCGNNPLNWIDPLGLWKDGIKSSGEQHGHSDFGDGWDMGFDYTREDRDWRTAPSWPLGRPNNHFLERQEIQRELLEAVRAGDRERFERLMHQGQDTFSHYDKGYRWPWTLGHGIASMFGVDPDNPYDENGNLNEAFRLADRFTRHWEDRWRKAREEENAHLFYDPADYTIRISWTQNAKAKVCNGAIYRFEGYPCE